VPQPPFLGGLFCYNFISEGHDGGCVDVVVFGIILDTHWMVGLEVIFFI
jgi:hypothetical protein